MAKLNQLFQDTSATATKQKSLNFSPLTLSKSPETFHQWVEDNISRKKKKKKQKSYLYAEDPDTVQAIKNLEPFPSVIQKRPPFVDPLNIKNEEGQFHKSGNMQDLYHHEKMFRETPVFDDKDILSHNDVVFPLNARSMTQLRRANYSREKMRAEILGNIGRIPLQFPSPLYS